MWHNNYTLAFNKRNHYIKNTNSNSNNNNSNNNNRDRVLDYLGNDDDDDYWLKYKF